MTFFERWNVERKMRALHGWLGALILPWVVLAGLTGFYMNHKTLVLSALPQAAIPGPDAFAGRPEAQPVASQDAAMAVAARFRPDARLKMDSDTSHDGRKVWTVDAGADEVVIDRKTGYVWVREPYRDSAFSPDGTRLGTEWRWSRILASLHERGWVGPTLGRWLADITAVALVVFGLSGIVLFWLPRLRRRRNRRARLRAAQP